MGDPRPLRLRYTHSALADIRQLAEYVGAHSPQSARRVSQRLRALIEHLPAQPLLGQRTDHPAIRRLTAWPYPYLIFYEVTQDDVIVHAVRHARRDPASMP
ncbi:type II toxin-antitoxin system RelE/ParE family toxin [Ancylobacter sp. WKF20]|uniref:type II toxin-antitoxin system RelE/ParE family toxin n=1 Tax=Ancylobacter sp. WKF20 TaxID=3039801 RepID=UPI002434505D|nr:type II toxin-antitoxin system RelE/ParE family toxin [Ancylobacter sp. WKF20]WGD31922.1 type II toxin-antitoxin system RelE/ParE family toxin [Ancylobacter sp. WKF20]